MPVDLVSERMVPLDLHGLLVLTCRRRLDAIENVKTGNLLWAK
jgi:hypothetical protein